MRCEFKNNAVKNLECGFKYNILKEIVITNLYLILLGM